MKPSSRQSRIPCKLSDSARHQLNMYALAASAAGVSVLALAQSAKAKIVYTPAHQVIGKNSYFGIDLNHDGIVDFTIVNSSFTSGGARLNWLFAWPNQTQSDGVEGGTGGRWYFYERVLKQGKRIGYGLRFYQKGIMVAQCAHGTNRSAPVCYSKSYNTLGEWANVKDRYLGLAFTIHGKYHYGWARLNVEASRKPFGATAILTGYAYETIPNRAIIAGRERGTDSPADHPSVSPATLGRLALGRK